MRDLYGVPHVFADSVAGAYFAAGSAEAEDQAEIFAELVLLAQGRHAEHFGPDSVSEDRQARALGHHRAAVEHWQELSPKARVALDAFAAGYNDYVGAHPELPAHVETITGADLAAIIIRTNAKTGMSLLEDEETNPEQGSNAAAISPGRSASGHAMAFGDPHLPWGGSQRRLHLVAPGLSVHGRALGPYFVEGRAGHLVLARTNNRMDGSDVYRETLAADDRTSYWDWEAGAFVPMESRDETILVAGEEPMELTLYFTRHGWIYRNDPADGDVAYALKMAVTGRIAFIEEALRQSWSESWDELLAASADPAAARRNVIVADDSGHIAYFWGGRIPQRPNDDLDYTVPLAGNTPDSEWPGGVWRLDRSPRLPIAVDPGAGWLQNCNDAPWWATASDEIPGREAWPAYVVHEALDERVRGQRLRDALEDEPDMDETELQALAFDTFCPNSRQLIDAVERGWLAHGSQISGTPRALELDGILRAWDARAEVDREGMSVVFHYRQATGATWPETGELPTHDWMQAYLDDLDKAAQRMLALYGTLHLPWGDMHVMERAGEVFPLAGGTGDNPTLLMRHAGLTPFGKDRFDIDGILRCANGSHSLHGHLLDPEGPRSWAIAVQGQINGDIHPSSPHLTDQTELYATQQWLEMWMDRDSVLANLCPYGDPEHAAYLPNHEHPHLTTLELPLTCGVTPVSDGWHVPGTAMSARLSGAATMRVAWDTNRCASHQHHLLYGDLNAVATYSYSGAHCQLGRDGESDLPLPQTASGNAFFLIVGVGADEVESHHGYRSDGSLRPADAAGLCGIVSQDPEAICP